MIRLGATGPPTRCPYGAERCRTTPSDAGPSRDVLAVPHLAERNRTVVSLPRLAGSNSAVPCDA